MKKSVSILIIIVLLFSLLSGCGMNKVSTEENLVNYMNGGYLYTSKSRAESSEERQFLENREKAVKTFIGAIDESDKYAFKVIDGLKKYENNLLDYIKKVDTEDQSIINNLEDITKDILACKTYINAKVAEIKEYMKMKSDNDAVVSIINSYLIDSSSELVSILQGYTTYLTDNTSYISYLLESINSKQAAKVLSNGISTYEKKVYENFNKMLFEFDKADKIYQYIASADYYANEFYFNKIKTNIDRVKSGDVDKKLTEQQLKENQKRVIQLEDIYNKLIAIDFEPDTIIPVPIQADSFSLIRKVSAATEEKNSLENGSKTLNEIKEVSNEKYDETNDYGAPENLNESAKAKTPTLGVGAYIRVGFNHFIINSSLSKEEQKRKTLENLIEEYQNQLSEAEGGTVAQYAQIIAILSTQLTKPKEEEPPKKGEPKKTEEQLAAERKAEAIRLENLKNQIVTNLNDLLKGDKDEFVNALLTIEAGTLIDTFNEWKEKGDKTKNFNYDKTNLAILLNQLGVKNLNLEIKVDQPDEELVVDAGPTNSQLADKPSEEPSEETSDPQETSEDTDVYEATRLIVSYEALLNLDLRLDNEEMMLHLYGWEDPLDYSQFEKTEKTNSDGQVYEIFYKDSSNNYVGWRTIIRSGYIEYAYYFQNDKNRSIEIRRVGNPGNSLFTKIDSQDENINRQSLLSYKLNNQEIYYPYVIEEKQDNKYDGLRRYLLNSLPNYITYVEGKKISEYNVKNEVVIREVHYYYVGSDDSIEEGIGITENVILNYDSGATKSTYTKVDGKNHGTSSSYKEDGTPTFIINYANGLKDGEWLEYYQSGQLKNKKEYSADLKNGKGIFYYDNGVISYEGIYSNDLRQGVWKSYTKDNILTLEESFKDDVYHGPYHSYALGESDGISVGPNGIHSIGQYTDGKRTGMWYFGYYNVGWVERSSYENGIRVWMEYFDSNKREYFNEYGTVIKTTEADKSEGAQYTQNDD